MSSKNTENLPELQAKYDLIQKIYTSYEALGKPTQDYINQQKIEGENHIAEWFESIQEVLAFKHLARQVQGENFFKKPVSPKAIIQKFFYTAFLGLASIWIILEMVGVKWLSWIYFLIALAGSVLYTLLMKQIKKEAIAKAQLQTDNYNQYAPLFQKVRRAESRIEPVYNNFLYPMLALVREEMHPNAMVQLKFDIRYWKVDTYKVPKKDLQASRHVTHTDYYEVPIFQLVGKLADGTAIKLEATKNVRERNIRKVNPRGKVKHKTKSKSKMVYAVQMGFPVRSYQPKEIIDHKQSYKLKQSSNEKRHQVKLQQVIVKANQNVLPQHKIFLDLISTAYKQVQRKG